MCWRNGAPGSGAFVLFVLLSLYVSIIADLNRPASGNIKESQEPMLMLRQSLKSQPPEVFDQFDGASPSGGQAMRNEASQNAALRGRIAAVSCCLWLVERLRPGPGLRQADSRGPAGIPVR